MREETVAKRLKASLNSKIWSSVSRSADDQILLRSWTWMASLWIIHQKKQEKRIRVGGWSLTTCRIPWLTGLKGLSYPTNTPRFSWRNINELQNLFSRNISFSKEIIWKSEHRIKNLHSHTTLTQFHLTEKSRVLCEKPLTSFHIRYPKKCISSK